MKETIKVCCPASYLFDEVLECDVEVVLVLARGQVERAPHPQRHGLAPQQLLGVDLMLEKHLIRYTSRDDLLWLGLIMISSDVKQAGQHGILLKQSDKKEM